jgi:hypothetical protein
MEIGMNWAGMPVWGCLLAIAAVAEGSKWLLIRRVRARHPYAWTELGQPGYFSKNSFDLVGRLTPYLRDPQDPVAEDEGVRRLIVLRRASWWLVTMAILVVPVFGQGNLLTLYQKSRWLSTLGFGLAALLLLVYFWNAGRPLIKQKRLRLIITSPNTALQRTRSASLRSPLSFKPFGDAKRPVTS